MLYCMILIVVIQNYNSNYKFTPNVAGKYFIGANLYGYGLSD